jgi:hypothetical protein
MNGGCAISLPSAHAIGLNRILGLTTREDLNEAYSWMRARTGNRFLQVNTDTASDELTQWIGSKGSVAYGPGWAKLRRSTDAVSLPWPGAVKTRKVRPDEAKVFGAMMCAGLAFRKPSLLYGQQSLGATDGRVSTRWMETHPWE